MCGWALSVPWNTVGGVASHCPLRVIDRNSDCRCCCNYSAEYLGHLWITSAAWPTRRTQGDEYRMLGLWTPVHVHKVWGVHDLLPHLHAGMHTLHILSGSSCTTCIWKHDWRTLVGVSARVTWVLHLCVASSNTLLGGNTCAV